MVTNTQRSYSMDKAEYKFFTCKWSHGADPKPAHTYG